MKSREYTFEVTPGKCWTGIISSACELYNYGFSSDSGDMAVITVLVNQYAYSQESNRSAGRRIFQHGISLCFKSIYLSITWKKMPVFVTKHINYYLILNGTLM